jgi:Uma2 family endonuclease
MSTTKLYTAEDLLRMPDEAWYELIEGELVEVSPSSGKSSALGIRIARLIGNFVDGRGLGYVTGENGGYILRSHPDTVIAPDVGFIQSARYPHGLPDRGYLDIRPDLAVEVISPNDEPADMRRKQRLYDQAEVPLVWWVDPKAQSVTVRRANADPVTLTSGDELDGGEILPGFRLAVSDIFDV